MAFNEFGYDMENRLFLQGCFRAMVLHSFREWKDVAEIARECAILVQQGKYKELKPRFCLLCEKVDEVYLKENPDIHRRILEMQHKEGK